MKTNNCQITLLSFRIILKESTVKSVHHFSSDQAINLAGTEMLVKVVQLQWRLCYHVCHLTKFLKSF